MYKSRLLSLLPVFLFACSGDKADGTDDTGGGDTNAEDQQITPLEGRWDFYGQTWQDDDCNGADNLNEPNKFNLSAFDGDTFLMEVVDTGDILGEVACTHQGEDSYACGDIEESFQFGPATLDLVGVYAPQFSTEDAASGTVFLTLDCTGANCDTVAANTNSGSFPCTSTQAWSASFVE